MDERVVNLLNYLGFEEEDLETVEVIESEYDDNVFTVDGQDYLILNDGEADEAHKNYIQQIIEDRGIEVFSDFAQKYILYNCVDTSWFDMAMRESYEFYMEDIRTEKSYNNFANRLEEEMFEQDCEDEASYLEYLCSIYKDGVQWYMNNLGKEDFMEALKKYGNLDIDKISDFCIEYDGRGHSLASYDGNELELENGYYAYRVA